MPKKGPSYPIDDEWRRRVEARMSEMGITSRAELARQLHCSRAAITELFSEDQQRSMLVPAIHALFGWDPPQPLFLSPDTQELITLYNGMSEFDRGVLLGRLRAEAEARGAPPDDKKTKGRR